MGRRGRGRGRGSLVFSFRSRLSKRSEAEDESHWERPLIVKIVGVNLGVARSVRRRRRRRRGRGNGRLRQWSIKATARFSRQEITGIMRRLTEKRPWTARRYQNPPSWFLVSKNHPLLKIQKTTRFNQQFYSNFSKELFS